MEEWWGFEITKWAEFSIWRPFSTYIIRMFYRLANQNAAFSHVIGKCQCSFLELCKIKNFSSGQVQLLYLKVCCRKGFRLHESLHFVTHLSWHFSRLSAIKMLHLLEHLKHRKLRSTCSYLSIINVIYIFSTAMDWNNMAVYRLSGSLNIQKGLKCYNKCIKC